MTALSADVATRMSELLTKCKLSTVAAQVVRRFTDAGREGALPILAGS